ncbi:MAG: YggT family protein [Candidatus Abyssobacteria bacterium SURF_17]|jgi:YggT family protein|uniref:YggT family protein n=1 Tax=Candidatus Abyssobacteria bacterium SURF_17 TaxID=2093361 RepID=A0A419EUF3_9BACT|nr:MAG: YggT family protein [Candidatus Abyssubacteria bacterium SURF_17]
MSVTIGIFIVDLLNLYSLLIIIYAVLSWMGLDRRNTIIRILSTVIDPVLDPIRRLVPPIGGSIDISPVIAFFLIHLVKYAVVRIFW